ncbi:MAG: DMT family transporter [Myxococcota bacterium]
MMIGATVLFAVMGAAVKEARAELSPFEIVMWRSVLVLPLIFFFARRSGSLHLEQRKLLLLRGFLGFGAMVSFFASAKVLLVTDITVISRLQPILVALLAPLVLGSAERGTRRVWLSLGLGLGGCLLIVGLDISIGSLWALLAVVGSVFSAGAHVAVRALTRTDRPLVIVFWFQLVAFSLAVISELLVSGSLRLLPTHLVGEIVVIGLAALLGQVMMTHAYASERASAVAAASYSAPLWGVLADLIWFLEAPSSATLIGGALVVLGGLLLVFRKPEPKNESVPRDGG